MEQSIQIKQGAIAVAVYLLLTIITLFVPVAGIAALFLLPVPLVYFTARFGWKPGLVVAAVALMTALLITVISLPFSLIACLGGIMTGIAIHQQLTPYETWARGTVGYLIGIVGAFLFLQWILGIDLISRMRNTVESSIENTRQTMESFGIVLSDEEVSIVSEQMQGLFDLMPVIFTAVALLLAFLTQWIGYKLLNKMNGKSLEFPPFRTFRLPIAVIWIYFIAVLVTIFSGEEDGSFYLAAVNVTNLAGLLVALHGLSFLFFYVHAKNRSKALPVIAILIVVFFPFMGLYLMRILGIIDLGFSLRDRIKDTD